MSKLRPPLVVPLGDSAALDPALTGHKAANLARLLAHGLPVPAGLVLTAPACREIQDAVGVGSGTAVERIRRSPLPDRIREAVSRGLASLGDTAVAVRSSGLAEDLADASFAGQYESVIGARGSAEVTDAIRRCLASPFSERVGAYRGAKLGGDAMPIAVLIQRLVVADAAGVAFTANPVTGDRDEIHINAVRGLSERLVAGSATPDEWIVRGGRAENRVAPEGALTLAQLHRVADLAARVEAVCGGPQDLEWAIADDELFLLQARPITALPVPPQVEIPTEGFWFKDETHYHAPITPFGASFYLEAVADAVAPAMQRFGVPLQAVQQRAIGGEVYTRAVPLGGSERAAPPWWLMAMLVRLVPALRRCATRAEQALRSGLADRIIRDWEENGRDRFRREAADLRRCDLAALPDHALVEHLDRTLDLLRRGEVAHFDLLLPYALALHELCATTRDLLGWSTPQTMALLSGISKASSEPGRRLAELADLVSASPAARRALATGSDLSRLQEVAPNVSAAWQAYLDDYGHRPLGSDPGEPTLTERPHLLVALVLQEISGGQPADRVERSTRRAREEALAMARSAVDRRPTAEHARFENALAAAEHAYRVRDDSLLYADLLPGGLTRTAGLEMGRRLVERGALAASEDAMFLGHEELRAALLTGAPDDLRQAVGRRRAERAWVGAHPGPPTYGRDVGSLLDLRGMPTALGRVLGALTWYQSELSAAPAEPSGDGTLRGQPGAPGRYSGAVRIIRSEADFGRLRPGDVLVCPTTSPAWSVVFPHAGALVTDFGGTLSHAAIIAREYGIPAVLSTHDGTRRLREGQVVTVDGTVGAVLVASSDPVAARLEQLP
jgi:rifampicin phosphotransferase